MPIHGALISLAFRQDWELQPLYKNIRGLCMKTEYQISRMLTKILTEEENSVEHMEGEQLSSILYRLKQMKEKNQRCTIVVLGRLLDVAAI